MLNTMLEFHERIIRLKDDTHSVTLTVRSGQLRMGISHFPQSLGTDEIEGPA